MLKLGEVDASRPEDLPRLVNVLLGPRKKGGQSGERRREEGRRGRTIRLDGASERRSQFRIRTVGRGRAPEEGMREFWNRRRETKGRVWGGGSSQS